MKISLVFFLLLCAISFNGFSQKGKWMFSFGGSLTYDNHYGKDFIPGDTVLHYTGSYFDRYPHPPKTYNNCVSFSFVPFSTNYFPLERVPIFINGQLRVDGDKSVFKTPTDSILKYEPYYSVYDMRYPLKSSSKYIDISAGISIGAKIKKFSVLFGAKFLIVSWERRISDYIGIGISKQCESKFFLLNQNNSSIKVIKSFGQFSYEFSNNWMITTTFYTYSPQYMSCSLGIVKILGK